MSKLFSNFIQLEQFLGSDILVSHSVDTNVLKY